MQPIILPFMGHRLATIFLSLTDSNKVLKCKMMPVIYNFVKSCTMESTAPPQQPNKQGAQSPFSLSNFC